jgi:hypothetical protein
MFPLASAGIYYGNTTEEGIFKKEKKKAWEELNGTFSLKETRSSGNN